MELQVVGGWSGFDVEVVDEAGFAKEGGEEDVAGSRDARDGLERLGVDDFGIVESGTGFGGKDFFHGGLERERVADAGGEFVAGRGERAIQYERRFALVGVEICVA